MKAEELWDQARAVALELPDSLRHWLSSEA